MASLALGALSPADAHQIDQTPQCRASAPLIRLPELPEASGITVSRVDPDRLWAHNDSGEPLLFALDARGAVAGHVGVDGATLEDWEAIAAGPCPDGSCLYVADIGDNGAGRQRVTIYRLPEPKAANGSAKVTAIFHGTYPDGPHDAEALLVAPDGTLHIVTKGDEGPVALYRFPPELRSGATTPLERVGAPLATKPDPQSRITDGAVSPDGQWVVLRTGSALLLYRAADLFAGRGTEATRVDLSALREPQGEGVAFGANNTMIVAGEGGGGRQPGTFARFSCVPGG